MKWNIGSRPTKPGEYLVILIAPLREYNAEKNMYELTGESVATIERKFLVDIGRDRDVVSWAMDGEPKEGLVWTVDSSSVEGEWVYAWADFDEVKANLPKLPERTYLWWEDN